MQREAGVKDHGEADAASAMGAAVFRGRWRPRKAGALIEFECLPCRVWRRAGVQLSSTVETPGLCGGGCIGFSIRDYDASLVVVPLVWATHVDFGSRALVRALARVTSAAVDRPAARAERGAGADRVGVGGGAHRPRRVRRRRGAGRDRQDGAARRGARRPPQTRACACSAPRGAELERDFAFGVVRQLFEPALADASDFERADLLQGAAGVAAGLLGFRAHPRRKAPPPRTSIRRSRSSTASTGCARTCPPPVRSAWSSTTRTRPTPRPCATSRSCSLVSKTSRSRSSLRRALRRRHRGRCDRDGEERPVGGRDPSSASHGNGRCRTRRVEPRRRSRMRPSSTPACARRAARRSCCACSSTRWTKDASLRRLKTRAMSRGSGLDRSVVPIQPPAPPSAGACRAARPRARRARAGRPASGRATCRPRRARGGRSRRAARRRPGSSSPDGRSPFIHPIVRGGIYSELTERGACAGPSSCGASPRRAARSARERSQALAEQRARGRRMGRRSGSSKPRTPLRGTARPSRQPPSCAERSSSPCRRRTSRDCCSSSEWPRRAPGLDGWHEHLQRAVDTAPDAAEAAVAAALSARALNRSQRFADAIEVLDRASASLGSDHPELTLRLEAAAVVAGMNHPSTAPSVAVRRDALRERADSDPARAGGTALGGRIDVGVDERARGGRRRPGDPGASRRETVHPTGCLAALFARTTLSLLWVERYAQLRPVLDASIAQARATSDSGHLAISLANRGWLALRRGDLSAAEGDARTAVEATKLPAPPCTGF